MICNENFFDHCGGSRISRFSFVVKENNLNNKQWSNPPHLALPDVTSAYTLALIRRLRSINWRQRCINPYISDDASVKSPSYSLQTWVFTTWSGAEGWCRLEADTWCKRTLKLMDPPLVYPFKYPLCLIGAFCKFACINHPLVRKQEIKGIQK